MSSLVHTPARIPVAEGIGIFVGIVAWDVLTVGHTELIKALLIAAAGSLVWYGVRYWQSARLRKRQETQSS